MGLVPHFTASMGKRQQQQDQWVSQLIFRNDSELWTGDAAASSAEEVGQNSLNRRSQHVLSDSRFVCLFPACKDDPSESESTDGCTSDDSCYTESEFYGGVRYFSSGFYGRAHYF